MQSQQKHRQDGADSNQSPQKCRSFIDEINMLMDDEKFVFILKEEVDKIPPEARLPFYKNDTFSYHCTNNKDLYLGTFGVGRITYNKAVLGSTLSTNQIIQSLENSTLETKIFVYESILRTSGFGKPNLNNKETIVKF